MRDAVASLVMCTSSHHLLSWNKRFFDLQFVRRGILWAMIRPCRYLHFGIRKRVILFIHLYGLLYLICVIFIYIISPNKWTSIIRSISKCLTYNFNAAHSCVMVVVTWLMSKTRNVVIWDSLHDNSNFDSSKCYEIYEGWIKNLIPILTSSSLLMCVHTYKKILLNQYQKTFFQMWYLRTVPLAQLIFIAKSVSQNYVCRKQTQKTAINNNLT